MSRVLLIEMESSTQSQINTSADLWLVKGDEMQISQVLNNLLINARQAIDGPGTVIIDGSNVSLSDSNTLTDGNYVLIRVEDNGPGVSSERLTRVFDPYYTTKHNGTGLGLSICYSIVKDHGGHISLESEEGQGATFEIYLPAADDVRAEEAVENARYEEQHREGEKVLIMDDDRHITKLVSRMLQSIGYVVSVAANGEKAIQYYQEAIALGEPFGAVILDLTIIGGMGGMEAIQKLLVIDPHVKAIVSSGHLADPVMREFSRYGFCAAAAKPYTMSELSAALHKILADGT